MKRFIIPALIVLLALTATAFAQRAARSFTINDLLKVRRVSDPQVSPAGDMIAYTIADVDKAANKSTTQIYLVPVAGGESRQLTNDARSSGSPRWSPDGTRLAFISAREGGVPQVWTIDVSSGELKKITNISTGAGDPVWSPDGSMIAFVSDVYPECQTDACNHEREQQAEESKVKAKVADRLLFRHWTSWKEGKRSHIFVVQTVGGAAARDLTPGDFDAPPFSLGGPADYAFSPDSKELAFARNTDRVEATSTNADIFVVSVRGSDKARRITGTNLAADLSPLYSPDGRYIAYRSQVRPGFESDRWRLMLYDRRTNRTRPVTDQLDASVDGFTFTRDGQTVYMVAGERGHQPLYRLSLNGNAATAPTKVIADGFNDDVKVTGDGATLVFTRNSASQPNEIFRASAQGGAATQITKINDEFIKAFNFRPLEEVEWTGGMGARVHGFVLKPANFSPSKKYPMVVLIHGGPQGAWNDNWGYRWNPQVFAADGYMVFMPNPRGSTGYGQKFVDEISGDWGGKAYTDIMSGVAHVIALGSVDKNRIGAAGGSYGGYMVNWIEGHNRDPRFQFKALVSHAGVFNLASMYGATEELWFTEWEFKGTPWTNPQMYARWSPSMFVQNFQTPMLVLHGEQDYRVPIGEGLQLFTALQRRNVESKLIYFPDEGHWILKPQNSELWYNSVLGWFDSHLKPKS